MTRKKFIKTLMGRGMSRNKARRQAECCIWAAEATSRINHEYKKEECTFEGFVSGVQKGTFGYRCKLERYNETLDFIEKVLL